jgi:prepilin-type processing-associated H-X9-DG protein
LRTRSIIAAILAGLLSSPAASAKGACATETFEGQTFAVCTFDAKKAGIRLFHSDGAGNVLGDFGAVAREAGRTGKKLRFAMNAGMYHPDRSPVGLYVEDGRQVRPIVTKRGAGNFSMLPNGIFYVDRQGPGILDTRAYLSGRIKPLHATQSGPMLVINGRLHPRFKPKSDNLKVRNGVGVSRDRKRIWFAISDRPVTFHTFARLFRDRLGARNALYLDGSVSRLYAPELRRDDIGLPMGPIVGVLD